MTRTATSLFSCWTGYNMRNRYEDSKHCEMVLFEAYSTRMYLLCFNNALPKIIETFPIYIMLLLYRNSIKNTFVWVNQFEMASVLKSKNNNKACIYISRSCCLRRQHVSFVCFLWNILAYIWHLSNEQFRRIQGILFRQ